LIEPNFSFNVEPKLLTTAMMASAIAGGDQTVLDRSRAGLVGQEAANGLHGLTRNFEGELTRTIVR